MNPARPSPASFPYFWADLKSPDFARLDAAAAIAVLPVAAIEQHGPHLPLSVDTDLVNGVLAHSLPHLKQGDPVLFLPTQTVGRSIEHIAFPGTLTLGAATLIQSWIDLGESVARTGIKKLVFLNAHGGNVSTLDIVG
ncbi:MAG: creatininase family protein, partial [Polaromonas sp.]|nr:creatininase family protein [Polaromonas sp.]